MIWLFLFYIRAILCGDVAFGNFKVLGMQCQDDVWAMLISTWYSDVCWQSMIVLWYASKLTWGFGLWNLMGNMLIAWLEPWILADVPCLQWLDLAMLLAVTFFFLTDMCQKGMTCLQSSQLFWGHAKYSLIWKSSCHSSLRDKSVVLLLWEEEGKKEGRGRSGNRLVVMDTLHPWSECSNHLLYPAWQTPVTTNDVYANPGRGFNFLDQK